MYRICATDADKTLDKAATMIGEMILGKSGSSIAKVADRETTLMPSWLKAAHERRAEEFAAHQDRPDRAHALTMSQHRELAREHEVKAHAEECAGNHAGAEAHQSAADAHHRAAALASDRHADFALVSHRAREASRRANRLCHEQVQIPGHAAKAAGGDGFSAPGGRGSSPADSDAFRSQAVRDQRYREPRANPYAFHSSGRVSGGPREAGDDNSPDRPVHPLAFLFDPVNDPRSLNWAREDFGSPGREREGATAYPSYRPATGTGGNPGRSFEELLEGKAAGIAPGESLTAFAKRLMSGSAETSIAKSLDRALSLLLERKITDGLYRDIVKWRTTLAQATGSARDGFKKSAEVMDVVRRIRASATLSDADRDALSASLMYA